MEKSTLAFGTGGPRSGRAFIVPAVAVSAIVAAVLVLPDRDQAPKGDTSSTSDDVASQEADTEPHPQSEQYRRFDGIGAALRGGGALGYHFG